MMVTGVPLGRCQAVQVFLLQQGVHTALFTGVPQAQGSRGGAALRLQGAPHQAVRVRGLRQHLRGSRGALPAHPALPPAQPRAAQVLRQAPVQVRGQGPPPPGSAHRRRQEQRAETSVMPAGRSQHLFFS